MRRFPRWIVEKVASCIELIRGLGFQAIISATNDKIQNYVENVDKTFVFANPNKKSISIQEFERESFPQLMKEPDEGKMMIDDKKRKFRIILEDCPVIAAVKDETGLKECLYSESQIIFFAVWRYLQCGPVCGDCQSAGKMVFVHMDLINGLGNKRGGCRLYPGAYRSGRDHIHEAAAGEAGEGAGAVRNSEDFCDRFHGIWKYRKTVRFPGA